MPLFRETPQSNPSNELNLVEILQGLIVSEEGGQIGIPGPLHIFSVTYIPKWYQS